MISYLVKNKSFCLKELNECPNSVISTDPRSQLRAFCFDKITTDPRVYSELSALQQQAVTNYDSRCESKCENINSDSNPNIGNIRIDCGWIFQISGSVQIKIKKI